MSDTEGLNQTTAVLGFLIGFLVVGVLGIYIGNAMIDSGSMELVPASTSFFYDNGTEITDTGSADYGNTSLGYWDNVSASSLYSSQQAVVDTFSLGVTFAKVLVIVSIAGIIFLVLKKTGLVPNLGVRDDNEF